MKKGHLCFSTLCWLNRNRSKKGKPAIYLRICVDGKRTEISTYGEKWISKAREKTQSRENVPLLPIAFQIIQRYKDDPVCRAKGTLFPVNTNQKSYAFLKKIAIICGIINT